MHDLYRNTLIPKLYNRLFSNKVYYFKDSVFEFDFIITSIRAFDWSYNNKVVITLDIKLVKYKYRVGDGIIRRNVKPDYVCDYNQLIRQWVPIVTDIHSDLRIFSLNFKDGDKLMIDKIVW